MTLSDPGDPLEHLRLVSLDLDTVAIDIVWRKERWRELEVVCSEIDRPP